MSTLEEAIGRAHRSVDPLAFSRDWYRRELERVFRRSWMFVAHDSLIPKNSDYFFFQAEDGIRDGTVTGVQTYALPIYPARVLPGIGGLACHLAAPKMPDLAVLARSEERRVGKECRSRWWANQ